MTLMSILFTETNLEGKLYYMNNINLERRTEWNNTYCGEHKVIINTIRTLTGCRNRIVLV